jgi:prolyl-tRNA synthetase
MLNPKDDEVAKAGTAIYEELLSKGIEVLLDDRDERPGTKFKDADLIGIPLRVTVGARGLQEGAFELQERRSGERELIPVSEMVQTVVERVHSALKVGA